MINNKTKGFLLGAIAAASYGMNPLFTLPLYSAGMSVDSVLFYRYALAIVVLGIMMKMQKQSFAIKKADVLPLCIMGLLFSFSSLFLFMSYNYMDAGIASTILFVYPVLVAIIMAVVFKEKVSPVTMFSIALAFVGISLLCKSPGGQTLSLYIQEYSMDRDIKNIVMDKGYVQNTIFELLSRLGIGYEKLEHSPIITMKEGSEIAYKLGSTSCKNLFLCNKRQEYFMLMLPADKKLSAKNVARQIGSPHLSFASAEDMERLLHTYPGAVSVLSLIYDKEKRVQLLIDKGLMNVTYIGCHPCTNTCSLKIKMEDILTVWLPATGHDDMKVIE